MVGVLLELDLRGRLVVVVGLGLVGRRRAELLLQAGAVVRVVEPRLVTCELSQKVELVRQPYEARHLEGASLVFASGPAELNARVVADARERGLWVASATGAEPGNVSVPARWQDGPLQVAVSTSGASPSLAKRLRDRIAGWLGPAPGRLAQLLAELRPRALDEVPDPAQRELLLLGWSDPRWLHRIESAGIEPVRADLESELKGRANR